jgi:hypothetical protein
MIVNSPRRRGAYGIFAFVLVAACKGGDTEPVGSRIRSLTPVGGDNQTGFVSTSLSSPLVVEAKGTDGKPLPGVTITFRVSSGTATVDPASAVTDATGRAQTRLTFGATPGVVEVQASVEGTSIVTTFTLASGVATTTIACQTGSPTLPAVRDVTTGLTGTGICLSGGPTGADYALIPFHASTVPTSRASFVVIGRGVLPLNSASLAPSLDGVPVDDATPAFVDVRAAFDARLRSTARNELTRLIPTTRAAQRTTASFNVIPSTVTIGQVLRLNTQSSSACNNAVYRGGRVAAISSKAIIVADTANPIQGFSDAQYQSIAVTFDTLIDPLDRAAFGEPSDIDKNGKVVIFFTRAVNELTPTNSSTFIGGFFHERDLFPLTSTPSLEACAGSNVGEMFYMLVPDPFGTINGNRRDTSFVRRMTLGTIGHEYQHLINAARRLYVNEADAFEESWLNEGLSHVAEELLFYRIAGLSPRRNLTAPTSGPLRTAFIDYQGPNLSRYESYLERPSTTSPYGVDDSIQTRGATWALLRYLADRRGASDGDTWTSLDNSKTTGLANLRNVFGTEVMTQIRDWTTAVFSDDVVAPSNSAFQQPSWNFRSIFTGGGATPFSLRVVPVVESAATNVQRVGGGAAYLRFSVPPGAQASLDWSGAGGVPVSPVVRWTVVRTR